MAEEEKAPEGLQFEKAEYAEAAPTRCASCQQSIRSEYYEAGGKLLCPSCRAKVDPSKVGGSGPGRFFGALGWGVLAGAAGASVWYVIRALTNYELGLIAVLVGWMVGTGVKVGSRGKGGWLYQGMAIALTYLAIVSTYVPDAKKAIEGATAQETQTHVAAAQGAPGEVVEASARAEPAAPEAAPAPPAWFVETFNWVFACLLAIVLPFLAGVENLIGILLIGFAVWEAWKLNRRQVLTISGPFRITAPPEAVEGEKVA